MTDHSSDDDLADMGEEDIAQVDYPLAKPTVPVSERKFPSELDEALRKAEESETEPQSLRPFQFTIRDMLIFTAVVAFLMGLIASISRKLPVFTIYSVFFLVMIATWFVFGLWKMGYWRKVEVLEEDDPDEPIKTTPKADFRPQLQGYSAVNVFLLVSAFGFLLSLCTFLPGEHKLVNTAGILGLCTLLGLVWIVMNETRRPMILLLWWLTFFMYLLTSLAVIVLR